MIRIRKISGLLSLSTLLVLVAADTIYAGITLDPNDKVLLVSMVSALLGVDILYKRGEAVSAAVSAFVSELNTNQSGGEDDDGS